MQIDSRGGHLPNLQRFKTNNKLERFHTNNKRRKIRDCKINGNNNARKICDKNRKIKKQLKKGEKKI